MKKLTQEVQHFTQRAYNTMDARLFVLAAYLDETGEQGYEQVSFDLNSPFAVTGL